MCKEARFVYVAISFELFIRYIVIVKDKVGAVLAYLSIFSTVCRHDRVYAIRALVYSLRYCSSISPFCLIPVEPMYSLLRLGIRLN